MIRRPVLSLGALLPKPLVLIVEDEPVLRLAARLMVATILGVHAAIACNGEDALEDSANAEFDLILMDIQMPVLGGLDAARMIRQLEKRTGRLRPAPIVAYTSNISRLRRIDLLQAGIDDVLEKPADDSQMRMCFDRWCPPGLA